MAWQNQLRPSSPVPLFASPSPYPGSGPAYTPTLQAHRSAPTLALASSSGLRSRPPSRQSHEASLRGLRPWTQPRTDEGGWNARRMPPERPKQDTPVWRPPGPSVGQQVVGGPRHRRPPPPPPPVEPAADDKSTELLADELRKSASILAQAQAQVAEERQLTALRQREAEAQLAEAVELGRQEERQRAQQAVRDANDTLAALAEANEQGAAFVKRVERAHIAGALAEQRRQLEHELNESNLATQHEIAELTHLADQRHARELKALKEELEALKKEHELTSQRNSELEATLANTKEGRVAAHHARAVRRMQNSGLTHGFTQWQSVWEEKQYFQRLIDRSSGRFFHVLPTVKGAFYLWLMLRESVHHRQVAQKADEWEEMKARVSELEAELAEEKAAGERRMARAKEEETELLKKLRALEVDKAERELVMEAQVEAEKQKRVRGLTESFARRVQHAGLVKGWSTWSGQWRQLKEERDKAKTMQQVRQRLMKPGLADPFLHWKDLWARTVARQHRSMASLATPEQQLKREKEARLQAEAEATELRGKVSELEQQLGLIRVALRDEQAALVLARERVEAAKQLELPAREAITKRREAETRCDAMAKKLAEASETLERLRRDASAASEAQREAAEAELRRLLAEQRKGLEEQMAQVLSECERRLQMMQERAEKANSEAQSMADEYAEKMVELQRAAAEMQLGDGAANGGTGGGYNGRRVSGKQPHLNTQDRAKAWEATRQEKEAHGLKPWEPWADGYKTANAFRAVRRFSAPFGLNRLRSSVSGSSKFAAAAEGAYSADLKQRYGMPLMPPQQPPQQRSSAGGGAGGDSHVANFRAMVSSSSVGCLAGQGGGGGGTTEAASMSASSPGSAEMLGIFGGGTSSPGGGSSDAPRRVERRQSLAPASHQIPAGYDAFLEGSKRVSRPGSAMGNSALGGPLGGSVVSGGSPQDSARLSQSSGPPGSARDEMPPRFAKLTSAPS